MIKPSTYFAILMVLGFLLLGALHEQVHVQIFKSYGINSTVHYFQDFPHFSTTTEPFYKEQCPNECVLANNLNEAIGYPLQAFYFMLGLGIYFIIERVEGK